MGQRSLMPGQCPGLPGFGYATVCMYVIEWVCRLLSLISNHIIIIINSNRSKLTLELSLCRTLLSRDFHSTFSSHCISTDYNHEMAILYLISYLHFANITFFSSLGRRHSCSQYSDCFFTTSTVTHNR